MFALENKVVIVTGAANGIGAAIVKAFLKEGVKYVAALDIDEVSGIALQNECNDLYGDNKTKFIKCDVTIDEQLFGVFTTVTDEMGYIDVVVNNAGSADESSIAAIRKQIEINYIAVVNSTLKSIDMMRSDQGGKGGTIINVSSITAISQLSPTIFVYTGTKSAIMQFSNCIGMDKYNSITGVRVLTIAFGATDTDIRGKMRTYDKSIQNDLTDLFNSLPFQTAEPAALGVIKAVKEGETGSTWLVSGSKISDITEDVKKAYDILAATFMP